MQTNFNDFFSVSKLRNGNYKLHQTLKNENNKNNLLRELGFRKTNIDGKTMLYQRIGTDIIPITPKNLKNKLIQYFSSITLTNLPENFLLSDINDWLYQISPIKQNNNFDLHLTEQLSVEEQLLYNEKIKHYHKKDFDKNLFLSKLSKWNFSCNVEVKNVILNSFPVYYKKIKGYKYLIFIQKKTKYNYSEKFECWLGKYLSEEEVKQNRPSKLKEISVNFELYKDFSLIEKYVS